MSTKTFNHKSATSLPSPKVSVKTQGCKTERKAHYSEVNPAAPGNYFPGPTTTLGHNFLRTIKGLNANNLWPCKTITKSHFAFIILAA